MPKGSVYQVGTYLTLRVQCAPIYFQFYVYRYVGTQYTYIQTKIFVMSLHVYLFKKHKGKNSVAI